MPEASQPVAGGLSEARATPPVTAKQGESANPKHLPAAKAPQQRPQAARPAEPQEGASLPPGPLPSPRFAPCFGDAEPVVSSLRS